MKKLIFKSCFLLLTLIMMVGALTVGCSKKQPSAPPTDTTATTNVTATPVQPLTVAQAVPAQAAVDPSEVGGKIMEAKTAMTTRDYTKAATALSLPQTTIATMSASQIAAYTSAKNALARSVVAAAAAGDPNAKAAMEKLRQDALYHR
jgi:hypothetical protein